MHQFIHINSYSLTTPKKAKEGGHSVRSIVGEANREPGNHPHVKDPQPPVLLHGKPLELLESTCETWASSMTDAKGRKLRKDALCLVAGVVSAPAEIGEGWQAFRDDSVAWLRKKYGDQLQTVVEHTDEDQPHLHFYVTPAPGQRFDTIHEGRAASDAIKGTGVKATKEIAYNAAMTRFQDDFSEAVALRHKLGRLGPGAPRVSRAEAVKRKEVRKELGAQLVREVKAAVVKGERRGFAQGKARGLVTGEAEGIEQAKAEFEKKSLFAKLTDFIKGLTRENTELKKELKTTQSTLESLSNKFDKLKSTAAGYFNQLKNVIPELEDLRSKKLQYEYETKRVHQLSTDLKKADSELSRANNRIDRLELDLEIYRDREDAENQKQLNLLSETKLERRRRHSTQDSELDLG